MAYAKWQYPYSLTSEQRTEKARLDEVDKLEYPLPEGSNRELHAVFFAALMEKRARWMDESKDYRKCMSQKANLSVCNGPLVGFVRHNLALVVLERRFKNRLYLSFGSTNGLAIRLISSPLVSSLDTARY